jgi:Terpene cyclase DEP1
MPFASGPHAPAKPVRKVSCQALAVDDKQHRQAGPALTWEVIARGQDLRQAGAMKNILLVVCAAFAGLTGLALWHHGYWGILEPHFKSFGAAQVLADLAIALGLFLVWMWRDARQTGRNPWPWLLVTLVAGSFGPLLYLLTRRDKAG